LLLWGFLLHVRSRFWAMRATLAHWWTLLTLSVLVNALFAAMLFPVFVASLLLHAQPGRVTRHTLARGLLGAVVLLLTALWGLGLIGGSGYSGAPGFGLYPADLLGLVNSMGRGTLLPGTPQGLAEEGYAYLGAGTLLLGTCTLWRTRRQLAAWREVGGVDVWPLVFVAILMGVYALATPWRLMGEPVLDLSTLYMPVVPLTRVFRSSGRFIWPLFYIVTWLVIAQASRLNKAPLILALSLGVQALDLMPGYAREGTPRLERGAWSPLPSPKWREAARFYRQITLFRPQFMWSQCTSPDYRPSYYVHFAYIAAATGMAVASGYTARPDPRTIDAYCRQLMEQMRLGQLTQDELYIVEPMIAAWLAATYPGRVVCGTLDTYRVCVSAQNQDPVAMHLRSSLNP
jgi:hypothetical protein